MEKSICPYPNKQANEFIFSRKFDLANIFHPPIKFKINSIAKFPSLKHLGIVLDSKLSFSFHFPGKFLKM